MLASCRDTGLSPSNSTLVSALHLLTLKVVEMTQVLGCGYPCRSSRWSLRLLTRPGPASGCYSHLGSDSEDGNSPSLSNSPFQINKQILRSKQTKPITDFRQWLNLLLQNTDHSLEFFTYYILFVFPVLLSI